MDGTFHTSIFPLPAVLNEFESRGMLVICPEQSKQNGKAENAEALSAVLSHFNSD